MAAHGLAINNIADAYATYWVEAWITAKQAPSAMGTVAQVNAVRRQVTAAMLRMPEVAGASDADKQQMAEALWLQAFMLNVSREQAPDKRTLDAISGAARTAARRMNLDLNGVRLTDDGFVPVSRKVGAIDPEPPGKSDGQGFVLTAALAGLSLGGLWLVRGRTIGG